MRRALLALVALVPALALGQGVSSSPPGVQSGRVLASFPLTTSGPLIAEDANTVAHVYWNGTALVDTKGNNWTMNGTVPQVTANPFTTTRYGAGPFSLANYYSLGTGSDVLDFAGDFTACAVTMGATSATSSEVVSDGGYGTSGAGWALIHSGTGGTVSFFDTYDASNAYTRATSSGTYAATSNAINVACFGRSGSTQYIKLNLGATGSTAGAKLIRDTTNPAMIGKRASGAATAPLDNAIIEFYATSSPFNEANVTAIQQKVLGHFDGSSALSVTRANSNATYLNGSCAGTDQCLWTVPANVARITSDGLLVEPQRINYALQSNTMSTGTAATAPWTLSNATVTTVAGAPLTGTWAEVTSTVNDGYLIQSNVPVTYTSATFSVWAAKASGTGAAGIYVGKSGAPTPTGCTCLRSDGGSCTTTNPFLTNYCYAEVTDLGTTPVRLSVTVTYGASQTAANYGVFPSRYGVSTGTTRFTGAQLEVGTYPTSLIVTTTTSATRNADQVSATVPAVPSKWCIAVTPTRLPGIAWSSQSAIWTLGTTYNAANTASSWTDDSLKVYDASGAARLLGGYGDVSSPFRMVTCDNVGSLSLTINGALTDVTATGAGTGVLTTPYTNLGIGTTSGGSQFGGYLKNLKICAASNAKGCK